MVFSIKKTLEYTHKCLFEFPFFRIGGRKYPFIDVDLGYISNTKEGVMCLIDSGADRCVFPKDMGDELGIDFTEAKVVDPPIGIAGKIASKAYSTPLKIEFLGTSFMTEVIWIDKQNITPVIGRIGFFDKFDVYFKQSSDKITLVFHSTPECHLKIDELQKG